MKVHKWFLLIRLTKASKSVKLLHSPSMEEEQVQTRISLKWTEKQVQSFMVDNPFFVFTWNALTGKINISIIRHNKTEKQQRRVKLIKSASYFSFVF